MKDLNEQGQILLLVVLVLAITMVTTILLVSGAQVYHNSTIYSVEAEKATALAEAGIDKAIESLNKTGGVYNGEGLGSSGVAFGEGEFSVKITSKDAGTKIVESTGYVPDKLSPKARRSINIEVSEGIGAEFNYGVQVGEGGLEMRGGNVIQGSIYSNGNIIVVGGGSENEIEGDAWVAGGTQPVADQQTDCTVCADFLFGTNVGGDAHLDVAMSFKPQTSAVINMASLKIKKIGGPTDATVRILGDSGGNPDKNNVLASGPLVSSLVTSSYPIDNWIDVAFATTPNLIANTTYWIMIDTSASSSNYWAWQNDLAQSYNRGSPKWSPNWNTGNPVWNSFVGDLSFKVFMGGNPTRFEGADNIEVGGNVHANTIKDVEIEGDAYYQTIISSSVNGTSYPGSVDPPPKVLPISDANILEWQDIADGDGTNTRGSLNSCVSTLDSIKIEGDVNLDGCNITVKSPIWITGNLILDNGSIFTLSSENGSTSGVIVVDGKVEMKNNNHFRGTGAGYSLLMVLSKYNSKVSGLPAVEIKNNGNSGVFYAGNGIIAPGNGNTFKELTAWKISLVQNSIINYQQGLSSTIFSSGPKGSFSLVKGTYQVK